MTSVSHLTRPRTTTTVAARPAPIAWQRSYALRLAAGDALAVVLGVVSSYVIRFGLVDDTVGGPGSVRGVVSHSTVAVVLVAVWLVSLSVLASRAPRIVGAGSTEYKRVVDASLLTFVFFLLSVYLLQLTVSRLFALLTFAVTTAAVLLGRWLWRQWLLAERRKGRYASRVVLVGSKRSVLRTAKDLAAAPQHGYQVVGVSFAGRPAEREAAELGLPIVGTVAEVPALLDRYEADTVMVTGSERLSAERVREMSWALDPARHQLLLAPSITDVAGSRVHLRPVAGLPLVHVEAPMREGSRWVAKRAFDATLSALLLVALLPVFAVIAAAIRRADGGPVFYSQERVGRDGTTFRIMKFRSMYTDADERRAALVAAHATGKGLFKLHDDPRVTPVGKFLRRYSLDELPQLVNVLRGEMSLVGPRPALPEEVEGYDDKERRRLVVTPGLSGLWQVSGRSDLPWEDGIRLDLYYVENWSMTGDLVILWRTAKTVLAPRGAY